MRVKTGSRRVRECVAMRCDARPGSKKQVDELSYTNAVAV
jgi:hypothetical protein